MEKKLVVGGQAVVEGVMMRGPKAIATAVRKQDGSIVYKKIALNEKLHHNFQCWGSYYF